MSLFGTKKPSSEPVVPEAVVEHKQSIGNQVMEALGVGEGANEYNKDEETEVMMPAKNQSQLAAEEMVKQHENICVISKDAIIRGGIEAKDALVYGCGRYRFRRSFETGCLRGVLYEEESYGYHGKCGGCTYADGWLRWSNYLQFRGYVFQRNGTRHSF